jgi:DnaJ-class molecular chaperone
MPQDKVPCESCGGTGYKSKKDGWVCIVCKGDRFRQITVEDLMESHIAGQNAAKDGVRDTKFADEWLHQRYGIKEEK